MRWYFDFISPYAYLQSTRLAELNAAEQLTCVPVLFAGLLKHWDTKGPAETAPKRRWTFRDIVWLAHKDGIPLTMPPQHPFNPLPLLRLSIVHNNEIDVVQRLFNFVWAEGKSPQDKQAFATLLDELNTSEDALRSDAVKSSLHENGQQAIDASVFGVPTIAYKDELFWGHSATDMLLSYIDNPAAYPVEAMRSADALPEGQPRNSKKTEHRDTPRIPLKPIDLAEPAELVKAIRERRGGELIELDRLLLYSQPLAEGWNHYIGNIRTRFAVEQKLRELAMCTVAVLNRAEYEFSQHAPLYIKAGGSEVKSQLLRDPDAARKNPEFELAEQLTIGLTTELTRDVKIEQALFDQAQQHFGNEDLVELIATIAAYNMVSRFLVAFELHP